MFSRDCSSGGGVSRTLQRGDTARSETFGKRQSLNNIDLENPATCLRTASRARPQRFSSSNVALNTEHDTVEGDELTHQPMARASLLRWFHRGGIAGRHQPK
jgi:hypothetical protein